MTPGSTRAEEAAARVALWKGRSLTISPLSGGLTNENYLVVSDGQRYVMRLPGQSTELLAIDRANEVYNTKAAATTGIGPKVLEHAAGVDVLLESLPVLLQRAGNVRVAYVGVGQMHGHLEQRMHQLGVQRVHVRRPRRTPGSRRSPQRSRRRDRACGPSGRTCVRSSVAACGAEGEGPPAAAGRGSTRAPVGRWRARSRS